MGTLPVPRPSTRDGYTKDVQDGNGDNKASDIKRGSPPDEESPGSLTLPVVHIERARLVTRAAESKLENRSDVAYYAQLNIGNPPQRVYAQLDTGSFELWVNPNCQNVDAVDEEFCRGVGRYEPSISSSAKVSTLEAELTYGIGSANITYVLDDIALPNSKKMKQVQFGMARSSRDQFSGILGVGHGVGINTGYKNFVDQLADQGVTKTKAYSVALGSKAEGAGVVVFGGVDTGKFSGKLVGLPIIPGNQSPDKVVRFWVTLDSMQHTTEAGVSKGLTSKRMPVFLDTGATLTLLPPALAWRMALAVGASEQNRDGFYIVDCGLIQKKGTIDFNFQGVSIRVPYREIVRETGTSPPSCYLGVMPSTSFTLLGDTFLRSAYVVFDISTNMTYMAPYVNCGSHTQSIDASTNISAIEGECLKPKKGEASKSNGTSLGTSNSSRPIKSDDGEESTGMGRRAWLSMIGACVFAALAL